MDSTDFDPEQRPEWAKSLIAITGLLVLVTIIYFASNAFLALQEQKASQYKAEVRK